MSKVLRLCLDLNIWCAALLAEFKGRQNTSCQCLISIVREGKCSLGEVKLVISWGMLNRLKKVLTTNLQVESNTANLYIETILGYAQLSPQLTLAGTGYYSNSRYRRCSCLRNCLSW